MIKPSPLTIPKLASDHISYLDLSLDIKSEPFEDPIDIETPESPLTIPPPIPLSESTPPVLVPILYRTTRMVVRVSHTMSSGLSAGMAEVATMSESAFHKRFWSSYESSPSVSSLDLPSRKRYRGTSELVEDSDDEEDEEIEESMDSDSVSEDAEDEGLITEDEDPAAEDEGLTTGIEGPGMDDEGYGLDDEIVSSNTRRHGVANGELHRPKASVGWLFKKVTWQHLSGGNGILAAVNDEVRGWESEPMIGLDPEPMIGIDDSCQLLKGVRVGL
ncbi:hypothetical protein Tco_0576752 [Tanacetum coccineum]